jgi:hypothetical protein
LSGFWAVAGAKRFRALRSSLRRNSHALPRQSLPPDFVDRLITPPLNRPNSAGGLLVTTRNSWMESTIGKYGTVPGSGWSTEIPS